MLRSIFTIILIATAVIGLVSCDTVSHYSDTTGNAPRLIPVGIGRIDITPTEPIRMSGYGGRTSLSSGVAGRLWAKALAIGEGEDSVLLVTLDLVGIPKWLTQDVVDQLGIPESNLALCATHTHSGPHLREVLNPIFMADFPSDHWETIERYSDALTEKVVTACRLALEDRKPGTLSWGLGEVAFAGNRRVLENGKWTGFGNQPDGPVDHSLPVMRIMDSKGDLRAVLANYACHCTTLGGDFREIHGDWAGEAQRLLEERYPGISAMIAIGCGADANPNPRGSMEDVRQNALILVDEVEQVLGDEQKPIDQIPRATIDHIDLPLDPLPKREFWEEHAASEVKTAHYAKQILKRLDAGESLPTSIDYPIQTWTFGNDLAMVFLAGEVVVDYSIKLKERFDAERIWINAYANAAPSYIPSRRLYDEGGYEVDRSMYYYDKPVRLSPDTEDLVLDEVLQQLPHTFYSESTLSLMPAPKLKEEALSTMAVHPELQIELVAAEPLVMDPIDIAWGADGRMWVVEMADYPLGMDGIGKGGGRIRFLEDSNKDGTYDQSTLFMDGVPFPTSVLPWNEGVLVTSPPDILYARDTNRDGQADDISTLYTGFNIGNQQHLVNGMQWGLDGWIYLANGDSGGNVRSIDSEHAISIDGRDIRIKPETGEIESIMGRSQFGRNRDAWGNWFGNSNSWPGWHYALEDRYLSRNPYVKYASSRVFLPEDPEAGRVFPLSKTLSRFNDYERANRFTSACGFMIYDDPVLGEAFTGNSFVAEPVHNLVSRGIVYPENASFRSKRAPEEREAEFLRSTDNWFRPTAIRSGPDGALYIVDMYRIAIEHPQWIPDDWQRKLNLREGHEKGRIYRISRKDSKRAAIPNLSKMSPSELVDALQSDIRWQRDQAQQLLANFSEPSIDEAIHNVARFGRSPQARIQALWTSAQRDSLSQSILLDALNDPIPEVRVQAVKLSAPFIHGDLILRKVSELAMDENVPVRIQVAYALGESNHSVAAETLFQLSLVHYDDPVFASAILSSAVPHQLTLAEKLDSRLLDPSFRPLLKGLMQTALGTENRDTSNSLWGTILTTSGAYSLNDQLAAYQEFRNAQTQFSSAAAITQHLSPTLAAKEAHLFEMTRDTLKDKTASIELRTNALRALAYQTDDHAGRVAIALQCLDPGNPAELQSVAIDSLARLLGKDTPKTLIENWNKSSPRIRNLILNTILSKNSWTTDLLQSALQQPEIARSFSAAQRNQLSRSRDTTIRNLAQTLFEQSTSSNRIGIVQDYLPSLSLAGDPHLGRGHFSNLCATCHEMDNIGVNVGPDLAALSDKSPVSFLTAILDPNRAVESKYNQFVATTMSNETAVGILSEESSATITLTTIGGQSKTLFRQNLNRLESNAISLMPEGLEAGLNHQQMADLLAFLNASDESLKIRADEKGEIALAANRAVITGSSAYYNSESDAIEWIRPGDSIEWNVYDLKPGQYAIFGNAGLKDEHQGRPFVLHMNDTFVTGAVPFSKGMDRFRKRKFGNIEILSDTPKAVFRLEHTLAGAEFGLKEIRLIPVP